MKKNAFQIILSVSGLLAISVVVAYIVNFHTYHISNDPGNWGTLGDYLGGVIGTIFGFASVLLIYLTFQRQQETSVLQQFETTFFNLLTVQREMMKSVNGRYEVSGEVVKLEGQEFFERMAEELFNDYFSFPDMGTEKENRSLICEYYEDRFEIAGPTLGPYYRHLLHFIKYTDNSEIDDLKRQYVDIIQAQMSDAELYCLFFNAICYGNDKLLPLLDQYSFLENIERKSLSFDKHKRMFFPNTKFKYDVKKVPLGKI